ncbi:hypothetical protein, variant 2 [Blastomyces dermatitidis ATCC 26199]|nr:hypothetical protein BDFG_07710 [Blastomyces dermatitidis ATCC 26199]EQL29721.1 hypothetical protein, variant 1 [Blastomyces dermatitidis ATCC 26199]EQL29722.1 hypothetical protein, variant 2 [Blastomyces dermatitidis ATCC 26199]
MMAQRSEFRLSGDRHKRIGAAHNILICGTARIPHKIFPCTISTPSFCYATNCPHKSRTMATVTRRTVDPSGLASLLVQIMDDMRYGAEQFQEIKKDLEEQVNFYNGLCDNDAIKPIHESHKHAQDKALQVENSTTRAMNILGAVLWELIPADDVSIKGKLYECFKRYEAYRKSNKERHDTHPDKSEKEHQHAESHGTYRSDSEKECHGSCSGKENESC